MVTADRAKRLQEGELAEILRRLDEEEVRLLSEAMERTLGGEVPMEVALAECSRAVEAHRTTRWAA